MTKKPQVPEGRLRFSDRDDRAAFLNRRPRENLGAGFGGSPGLLTLSGAEGPAGEKTPSNDPALAVASRPSISKPAARQIKWDTAPGNFARISLKTKESGTEQVGHSRTYR
jgi:hypothetical protein